jgi:zinc transport system substrate-binding protein
VFSRIVLVLAAGVGLAAASGCSSSDASGDGRPSVVAAFYPLAWAAEEVAGTAVEVHDLTPAGAEPHDLELTPRDVERVRDADVVLYLRGFQPALDDALEGASGRAVDLARADTAAAGDPLVWLDPRRYADTVERIAAALGPKASPDALLARLRRLDGDYARGLAACRRRQFVTAHAAFGHLAARYGLEQIPLAGLEPEAEPSPQELERLAQVVARSGATTVFTEPLASGRAATTVAREAGVRTAVLDPIEGLTPDRVEAGDDYVTVMRRNLRALRQALDCR